MRAEHIRMRREKDIIRENEGEIYMAKKIERLG